MCFCSLICFRVDGGRKQPLASGFLGFGLHYLEAMCYLETSKKPLTLTLNPVKLHWSSTCVASRLRGSREWTPRKRRGLGEVEAYRGLGLQGFMSFSLGVEGLWKPQP